MKVLVEMTLKELQALRKLLIKMNDTYEARGELTEMEIQRLSYLKTKMERGE